MPVISVIVPVYKVECFLERCLDSILGQSFSNFELIAVDDGSPDRSGEICEEYAARDSRVHVIHQENGGLSAARNAGIRWAEENSDSRWLTFVDSDDWLDADFLKRMYQAVQDTGCAMAACDYYITGGESVPAEENAAVQSLPADEYYCLPKPSATPVACAKLYSKHLFASLRFPLGKLHEDEFTTYRAVYAAGQVAYVPAAMYAYYSNPDSITLSKWNPRRLHVLEAFEEQMAFAREQGNDLFYKKAVKDKIFGTHEQLVASTEEYHDRLRADYRKALKLGRQCGVFPFCWDNLWAYEEAYPVKLFWWPLFKGRQLLDRLTGRGEE